MVDGQLVSGATVTSEVDSARRRAISRAHTATHMIHRVFRERLGDTATQMGSENAPGRLRFDFPSPTPVAPAVLREVEAHVNAVLIDDLAVTANTMTQDQARAMGAMALFGEKYGDRVRVVSVGDWAHELCGGTHAQRSGQLGVVTFLSEGSIGAGVRRVEALVGADAYQFLAREHVLVNRLSELVKAPAGELVDRVERTIAALKEAEKELAQVRSAQLVASLDGIIGEGKDVGPVRLWSFVAPEGTTGGDLRELVVKAKGRGPPRDPRRARGRWPSRTARCRWSRVRPPEAIALGRHCRRDAPGGGPEHRRARRRQGRLRAGRRHQRGGIPAAFEAVEALIRERTGA